MRSKSFRLALHAVLLAIGMAFLSPVIAADDEFPYSDRRDIEDMLKAKASALLSEKDADGHSFKRGNYSHAFHKVDDATCTVTFHRHTALGDEMLTERFLLTFKKDAASKNWSIAKEELQDSFQRLTRPMPGDEQFFKVDKFSFDREGMKITVSNGFLIKDFEKGALRGFAVGGPDLAWEYVPPIKRDQALYAYLRRDRPENMNVKPDYGNFTCDRTTCEQILAATASSLTPTTLDQVNEAFRHAYLKTQDDLKDARRDNPFSGFSLPDEPDHRYFTAAAGRLSPEKYAWLTYDNHDPKEVAFGTAGLGPLFTYGSEETRKGTTDPLLLERRDDAGGRLYDLEGLRGTVELALGDAELVVGDATFTLTTKRELRELPFFIARPIIREEKAATKNPSLFINSVQDGEGNDLTWVKTGQASGLVIFPKKVPAGTELVVRMQFENRDSLYKLTSTYTYMDRGGWLPFVRFGDMIHDFDLTVKVPDRYQVLGIGGKVSESKADGVLTTRWIAENAVDFPTVIFGVYLNEASKVKATKSDGTEIPVIAHVDRDTLSTSKFFLVDEDGSDQGFNVADAGKIGPKILGKIADDAANALNIYREIFGVDYPYNKLDLVNDPLGFLYGQAPSSIVYLGTGAFHGEGKLGSMGGGGMTTFTKGLVAHEVAHQWWGSLITNSNFFNYWFVESLAEYSSALFVENVYGKKMYQEHVDTWRRTILEREVLSSVQDASVVWNEGYQAAVYNKGPYAFHVLREMVGDEKFFKFLKTLAQDLEGQEIVTRDIQKVAEKSLGGGMEWFFDQWIRGVGIPDFTVTYSVKANEDGSYMVQGQVDQKIVFGMKREVMEGEFFQGIFALTAEMKGGKEARLPIVLKGASTPFQFKLAEKPKGIVGNKYGEILAQDVAMKVQT
jgi:hypothetical protein